MVGTHEHGGIGLHEFGLGVEREKKKRVEASFILYTHAFYWLGRVGGPRL